MEKDYKTTFFYALILAFLQLLMISTDPEKMAPILNHIVEIEGIQASLYGILVYVRSSMCFIKH